MLQLYTQTPKTELCSTNAHSSQKYEHLHSESGWTHPSASCTWGQATPKYFILSDIQVQIKEKGLKLGILPCSLTLNPSAADFIRYPKTDTREGREEHASRLLKCSQ